MSKHVHPAEACAGREAGHVGDFCDAYESGEQGSPCPRGFCGTCADCPKPSSGPSPEALPLAEEWCHPDASPEHVAACAREFDAFAARARQEMIDDIRQKGAGVAIARAQARLAGGLPGGRK